MDFNNNQNEPQNQQNSNVSYQPKKGTFFKKKIIYGFFMFIVFLIILLTFRKEIFSSDDTNQNNKKIIKNEVSKEAKSPDSDNTQYGEEDMQDLGYGENDENGGLTDEELNYVIPGDDEESLQADAERLSAFMKPKPIVAPMKDTEPVVGDERTASMKQMLKDLSLN